MQEGDRVAIDQARARVYIRIPQRIFEMGK